MWNTIPLWGVAGGAIGGVLGQIVRLAMGTLWGGVYWLTMGWGIIGLIIGFRLGKRRALQVPESTKQN
jgi:hypothetical protein